MEQSLMAIVSEKGARVGDGFTEGVSEANVSFAATVCDVEEIERPLAQSLEGWVLQQAVAGLMLAGQLEQAEALCSQVRPAQHYSVLLLADQV